MKSLFFLATLFTTSFALTRRSLLASVILSRPSPSFSSLAPSRVHSLDYDSFLAKARQREFETVQIAVQHDHVVGKTREGKRYVTYLPDSSFPTLLSDAMDREGIPFRVLPMDKVRSSVREVAKGAFSAFVVLCILVPERMRDLFGK